MEKRKYGLLSNIGYALKNIWVWDKIYFFWFFPAIPLEVFVPLMGIYFPKLLIDGVEEGIPMERMLGILFGYFLLLFLADAWRRFCGTRRSSRRYLINNRYELAVDEKYMRMDYANVEDPKVKEKYSCVMNDVWHSMSGENIWESLLNFLKNILGIFSYGGIICFASPIILIFLAFSTAVTWWMGKRNIRWYDKNRESWVDLDRHKDYIASFSRNFAYAKDIRIHRMAGWLDQRYQKWEKERIAWRKRMTWVDLPETLTNLALSLLQNALSYAVLCSMLIGGKISLGDFTFYFSAVAGFSAWLNSIVYGVNGLFMQGLAIGHYREYFSIKDQYRHEPGHALPREGDPPPRIELDHVSFRYEKDGEWLFDDVSFQICPGERLAVVGENGAGKTTLVKLICGLYFPEKGSVRINGIPTTEFNIEDYYSLFAAVFQDIYLLPVSILDFVASCKTGEGDVKKAAWAIEQAGLKEKIDSLEKGLDTLLVKGVHSDAVEFSGGENQKLMLARALYKDAPVIVLDEPTAALDPIAESGLYEQYHGLTRGRTGIYISHRLASTGFCDRILFLEHGKVAEEGSHKELMAKGGKYARMYRIQSQYYQENGQKGGAGEMRQAGKTQNKKTQQEKKWETMTARQINREGFAFFHRICPNFVLAEMISCIVAGISPYFNIYMTAEIVDRLSKGVGRSIYPVVIFTVAGNFVIEILQWILGEICGIKNRVFLEELNRLLTVKVQSMDYQDIEDPKVQQLRRKMLEDMGMGGRGTGMFIDSICNIVYGLSSVLTAVGFFVELVILLLFAKPLAGIAFLAGLCVLLALNIIASMKYQKAESKMAERNGGILAEENRMEDALDCSHNGKDIRIYRQERMILPLKRRYLIDIHWEMFSTFFKKVFRYETIPVALKYLLDLFIYAMVCIYALLGVIGVGSIIKYIGFVKRMTDSLMGLSRDVTALKFNTPFLAQFFRFFYYPSVMHDGTLPVGEGCHEIEFCNVSFRYPGSETYALRNVSLTVREGERTAIVGRNGSGKTTLIKLLCRLYDPTEGVIRLDGRDIREYQYDEYIRLFSAVFQDYKLFAFSILENVASSEEPDRKRVAECLELAGFGERLSEMPKGLDTVLYKDFEEDGVEISGGEAQKIAVARAIYQDASFVLLDEPTAALDPISEHELYQKFDKISKGKTVIYISHRLSSCCFCNRILVLKDGGLVSDGPHEKLLKESDEYRGLWNAQAQYYAG